MSQALIHPPRPVTSTKSPWPMVALVVAAAVLIALFAPLGIASSDASDGCCSSAYARAGSVTTMVIRFNQFLPGGAAPIELVGGRAYRPSDLAPLVTAGYCGEADLQNQIYPELGWVWNSSTRKFTPELDPDESFPWVLLSLDAAVGAAIVGTIIACGVIASRLWPHRADRPCGREGRSLARPRTARLRGV